MLRPVCVMQGSAELYSVSGRLINAVAARHSAVTAMACVGMHMWMGLADGTLCVWDCADVGRDATVIKAHACEILQIVQVRVSMM